MMEQMYRHLHIPEDVLNTGDFNALVSEMKEAQRMDRYNYGLVRKEVL